MHCKNSTARCPRPRGKEAVHCTTPSAHCPEALWHCIAGSDYPLRQGSEVVPCTISLPTSPKH